MIYTKEINGLNAVVTENELLRVEVVPDLGGKIISIYHKDFQKEFLWNNKDLSLEKLATGSDYESNFWGGIDELIPNDVPEQVDGIHYPDHGELWTTVLSYEITATYIRLSGLLEKSGLHYQKTISLCGEEPKIILDYRIKNQSTQPRHFLWKQHAALRIREGDILQTKASSARIVNPEYSRFSFENEFNWPMINGVDAGVVPPENGTMDFFYLYNTSRGEMSMLLDDRKYRFSYYYDQEVFPYQWYFASYGQFRGHYTVILEPATAMPGCINEAAALGQCSVLDPGGFIQTTIEIYAGINN